MGINTKKLSARAGAGVLTAVNPIALGGIKAKDKIKAAGHTVAATYQHHVAHIEESQEAKAQAKAIADAEAQAAQALKGELVTPTPF
jgi:hypothetical protein